MRSLLSLLLLVPACLGVPSPDRGRPLPHLGPVGYEPDFGVDPHIVAGEDAPVGEYPWQGSLEYLGGHTCGCVLISERYVLTAAHCVDGRDVPSRFQAWFGVHDRGSVAQEGTKYDLDTILMHPDYVSSSVLGYPNDIAYLMTTDNVDLTEDNVATAELDASAVDHVHSGCMMSGWGRLCGSCSSPDVMQHAPIDVITKEACQDVWGVSTVGDYHVCVHDTANQETMACSGDSGGPLQCTDVGHYQVVGLASWTGSGCNPEVPAAYVRVSYFCDWILQHTGVACG